MSCIFHQLFDCEMQSGPSPCIACDASLCVASQYLDGCGDTSEGSCVPCPPASYTNTSGKKTSVRVFRIRTFRRKKDGLVVPYGQKRSRPSSKNQSDLSRVSWFWNQESDSSTASHVQTAESISAGSLGLNRAVKRTVQALPRAQRALLDRTTGQQVCKFRVVLVGRGGRDEASGWAEG